MYPLLSFGSLTADIKHAVCQVANDERGLCDAGGLNTRSQDILVVGYVIRGSNAIDGIKVARDRRSAHASSLEIATVRERGPMHEGDSLFGGIVQLILS